VSINVPLQPRSHAVHSLHHTFNPRVAATAISAVRWTVRTRRLSVEVNQRYFLAFKDVLEQEMRELESFKTKRAQYEESLIKFNNYLVNSRRQRAMQLDINQRKERLNALRDLRLHSMQEAKKKQLMQEAENANIKALKEAAKKSTVTVVAQQAKKAVRAIKDKIRDMRYHNDIEMDEEEQNMARNIREKSKEGVGSRPEAIREIKMTVGFEEAEAFQRQNDHLQSKGLPFYRRMSRSIGNKIYIWTQTTKDSSSFITSFELGHPVETNALYKTPLMRRQFYELIDTPATPMQIWVKRDHKKISAIKAIHLSFTEEEETRYIVDKFVKVDVSLANFDLPDTYLWLEKVDKIKIVEIDNTNKLIAEIKKGTAIRFIADFILFYFVYFKFMERNSNFIVCSS
jgi:hypothetical protein